MIRRPIPYAAAFLCAAGLCLPSLAAASSSGSGGGSLGSGSSSSSGDGAASGSGSYGTTTQNQPATQPGDITVSATGGGMTISTSASALLRRGLAVSGSLPTSDAGRTVEVEVSGSRTHWLWQPVASSQVQSDGSFTAVWATNHIGRFAIRAVVAWGSAASASAAEPTVTVTVYRPSLATLYGPGFYGRRTACGVILRRSTIGVANRTLPCGTPVAIYYAGQTLIVPVIDRGPYANGADWDLTMATGKALGMTGTATLGAASLPLSR